MFSRLKKWWSKPDGRMAAVRIPRTGMPALADGDATHGFAPTRIASPAARERFCADVLRTQADKNGDKTAAAVLPFEEGATAYDQRKHWRANRYPERTWQHEEWDAGWRMAEEADNKSFDWVADQFKQ
jgi:hypothetical protein